MFKELGKSILIYGVASSIGKFIGLFFVPIYTRIFSPEDYGVIDIISVTISFVSILGILQLESAISRYYYASKDEDVKKGRISTVFWTVLFVSSILVIVLIVFSSLISNLLFDSDRYASIISLASFILPLTNIFAIYTVIIRFLKRPVHYTFIILTQLSVTIAISILLVVYLNKGIFGVFIGQLSGLAVGVFVGTIYLRDQISFIWNRHYLKEMFYYSLPMVPAVAGGWINSNANRFVMIGYLSLADIGLYTIALKISSIMKLLESAFRMAWGPFFWEMFEKVNHREIYQNVSKYLILIIFSITILISLFSQEMLMILTPKDYHSAYKLVGFIVLSFGLTIINQTIGVGPGITKKTYYNTAIYFASIAVNISTLFILVPVIGLMGVPLSLFFGSITLLILAWYYSEKLYYVGFSKLAFIVPFVITSIIVFVNTFFNVYLWIKILVILSIILAILISKKSKYMSFSNLRNEKSR